MKQSDLLTEVAKAVGSSALVKDQEEIKKSFPDKSALFVDSKLKALTKDQIKVLEGNLNSAEDWSQVRVAPGFDPRRVRECRFLGKVALGSFKGEAEVETGIKVPTGLFRSFVSNCEIGNEATVCDVRALSHVIVKENAVLFNCGSVLCSKETSFGNGIDLPIAIETGGREVKTYAEITVDVAAQIATSRSNKKLLTDYVRLVEDYAERAKSRFGVIGEYAVVKNTSRVENVYVGAYCRITDVSCVKNVTLLGTREEPAEIKEGAFVRDSILQWGCEVATGAIVDRSVLTEHSHVERHGKVTDTLVGPNTGIAEGEVTACLVGPFVGFHHQSILIAAFWPEGKGNVGYGANVGSNHTSKAPDQEIWPGEGTFFGLGVNIKFPSDFTRSPYSIIATAVNALPQKVTFPFSLINSSAAIIPGISPAYNEIMPAWVLSDNIFTVKRNEGKYQKRNKARRSEIIFEVFRPDIVDLMLSARKALQSVKEKKEVYTDRDIRGLGKNYLKEKARLKAIEAYTFYLRHYALTGLKREIAERSKAGKECTPEALLKSSTDCARWSHERKILLQEGLGKDFRKDLESLAHSQEIIAKSVQASKEKDDIRGARIIPDYAEAHAPAKTDSFVKETWKETEALNTEISQLLTKISNPATATSS
jgi:hypothetical protein